MGRIESVSLPTEDDVWMELDYDGATGVFRRRKTKEVAGSKTALGYVEIRVRGKRCYAHRLAWFMATGDWPTQNIDHINGDRADNRIANLRDVSQSTNRENVKRPKGRSGLVGVSWNRSAGKWVARIKPTGAAESVHLGSFAEPEDARAAYLAAKVRLQPMQAVG